MASKLLEQSVSQGDDGWDFVCPGVEGSLCGEEGGAPFTSTGWPTKASALARGREHFDDHLGTPMSSLEDFRAKHGLGVTDDGKAVRLEDLA